MAIDTWDFRLAMGAFATGVTVMTAPRDDGSYIGVTVNSFCSVSLEPPLVLWCLKTKAHHFRHFQSASHFNVNVLAADQLGLAQRFAGRLADRFSDIPHRLSASGLPLIAGCIAHLECRTCSVYPGGDHAILLGEVEKVAISDRPGLVFHNGRFAAGAVAAFDWIAPRNGDTANDLIDFW
jgi:flavin reductase (DIM6/NTAB) family NADH-FMN oxidoreductase RutF